MPETQEIKQTIYRVGNKEYTVGETIKLPKKVQKLVLEIKKAAEKADTTLEKLYKNILMDGDLDDPIEDIYFVDYTGADQRRKFYTSEMNRALYEHFGGFVPIQLELNEDEPTATVRERQPNENPAITAEQVKEAMDITKIGLPLKNTVASLPGEQDVVLDYNLWRMLNGMVFSREFTPTENFYKDIPKDVTTLEDNEMFQTVYNALAPNFGTSEGAYAVIVFNGDTVQAAAISSTTASEQQLGQIYGVLMSNVDREKPIFSVSCFIDLEPDLSSVETGSESGPPIKVFNIMLIQLTEEGNIMSSAQYTVDGKDIKFKQFLNHNQILEKNEALKAQRAGTN